MSEPLRTAHRRTSAVGEVRLQVKGLGPRVKDFGSEMFVSRVYGLGSRLHFLGCEITDPWRDADSYPLRLDFVQEFSLLGLKLLLHRGQLVVRVLQLLF